MQPNEQLMDAYGTGQVKEANLALAAQIASSVLGLGLMVSDKDHREKLKVQAAQVNMFNRVMEADRMDATINAFKGASAQHATAAGQSMAKIAAFQAGELEWSDLDEMEKEAFGALIGGAMKLMGKGVSGVGKMVGKGGGATARLQQASGQATGGVGRTLRGWGAGMQRSGGSMVRGSGTGTQRLERAMGGSAKAKPALAPAAKAKPSVATAGAADVAGDVAKKKPLIGWKTKALAGGAAGVVAYGGYKGLQSARDYMMMPAASGQRYGGYRPNRSRVSSYGQATY